MEYIRARNNATGEIIVAVEIIRENEVVYVVPADPTNKERGVYVHTHMEFWLRFTVLS